MAIQVKSKKTWVLPVLASLLACLTQSCDQSREQIDALVWKGSPVDVGIIRDITCSPEQVKNGECKKGEIIAEEFMRASSPTFSRMRCLTDTDANRLIEEAMRRCR
jgi:hypothetical protein